MYDEAFNREVYIPRGKTEFIDYKKNFFSYVVSNNQNNHNNDNNQFHFDNERKIR